VRSQPVPVALVGECSIPSTRYSINLTLALSGVVRGSRAHVRWSAMLGSRHCSRTWLATPRS